MNFTIPDKAFHKDYEIFYTNDNGEQSKLLTFICLLEFLKYIFTGHYICFLNPFMLYTIVY